MFLGISWVEWVGYLASVTVAVSLTMSSIVRLRWLNMAGALVFTAYGTLIEAWPVAFLNGFIVAINIYYLRGLYARREDLQRWDLREAGTFIDHFLRQHLDDIKAHNPGFEPASIARAEVAFFVLRDLSVASLFVAERLDGESLLITADYATPPYRDLKPGNFIYRGNLSLFKDLKVRRLLAITHNQNHTKYLLKMGFMPSNYQGTSYLEKII